LSSLKGGFSPLEGFEIKRRINDVYSGIKRGVKNYHSEQSEESIL